MPALPAAPVASSGQPFTRADLADLPEDGHRYEVIDGVLLVSAAPGRLHQRATLRMARLLDDACPPEFEVLVAPFGVGLADDTEVQPDVVVGRASELTDQDLPAAPALAVEVLSPSSRLIDTVLKRERLQRAGTAAYWVVDPVARPAEACLTAWQLTSTGEYEQVAEVYGDEAFPATVPFPVRVVPADLVHWPSVR